MRILVTGAKGMLGTDLLARLGGSHTASGVDMEDFDITDELMTRDKIAAIRPEWVVHCAAYTNVDGCEKEPERAFRVNAEGAGNVAKACWGAGGKMLYVSTDYVYDGKKGAPYIETDPVNPLNVYGMSKLKGEKAVQGILPDALIVRTSWLFGVNGPNFVNAILSQVGVKDELSVVDDQVGSPTCTVDLADALVRLMEEGASGVVHASNDGKCSWYGYAKRILELSGVTGIKVRTITTEELGRPALRPAYSVLSNERYRKITGHRLRMWDEALMEYLKIRAK